MATSFLEGNIMTNAGVEAHHNPATCHMIDMVRVRIMLEVQKRVRLELNTMYWTVTLLTKGGKKCYSGTYSNNEQMSLSEIRQQCQGTNIMYGCKYNLNPNC